jgi:hypothetical protein
MIVAIVALISSLAGTAVAARLITSKQVKNGSLLAKDFKKGQLPKGAVKSSRGSDTPLDSSGPKQVGSLSINAPSNGFVTLTYGATIDAETPATWIDVVVSERGKALNGKEWWDPGDADGNFDLTQTNQLVLPVKRGKHTYSLELKLSAGTALAHDARLAAAFFPASL